MDSQGSYSSQDSSFTVVDESKREILYFAYGSNLSTAQMRSRCPFATPIGLARLPHWRWIINARGFANVVPSPPDSDARSEKTEDGVYGLLYLLPIQDEGRLDSFEGVPEAYSKRHLDVAWVADARGRTVEEPELAKVRALVYVDERVEEGEAGGEYVGRMEQGIRDVVENWGFPEEYADRVMRRFWSSFKK